MNQLSIHTWGTILSQAILKKVKKRVPRTLSIKSSGPLFLNFIRKKKIFFANISHFTLLLKLVSHNTSIKGRYDRKSVVDPEKVQNQNSLDFPLKNNCDKLIVTPCSQSVHFIKRLHASTVIDWILWRLITYKIKRIRNLFNFRARVFCLKKKKKITWVVTSWCIYRSLKLSVRGGNILKDRSAHHCVLPLTTVASRLSSALMSLSPHPQTSPWMPGWVPSPVRNVRVRTWRKTQEREILENEIIIWTLC